MRLFGRSAGGDGLQQRINSVASRRAAGQPVQPARTTDAAILESESSVDQTNPFERAKLLAQLAFAENDRASAARQPQDALVASVEQTIARIDEDHRLNLSADQIQALAADVVNDRLGVLRPAQAIKSNVVALSARSTIDNAVPRIYPLVMERIDSEAAGRMNREQLSQQLLAVVAEILVELKIQFNRREQRDLVNVLLNDMLGLGPLEPLLADETISDIMVNGPKQVYVERRGKLELTDATFRDNTHVMSAVTRIVSAIGRRIDESTPLVDARLADGSRVNIIIPPLAIDGPSISIRKFSKKTIDLDVMARQRNISPAMATVLKIAARCQLNILISGGTGSGKTTLLNALSQMIDGDERIVTIEDAAELQLQQPHVVRLETRPPNLEGRGEITMRDLVKNALRMRPDRIILGEIRGAEAIDMLQAMNTGHDGSLGTIHANRPREALTRLENMVGMSGIHMPSHAVRTQIAGAVHMILQVSRMRDGVRRITSITEILGMQETEIATQELFRYQFEGEDADGNLCGRFECLGVQPHFLPRAEYYGLGKLLGEAIGGC
ncbi:MAG TPA: CpaF family protein [Alphaproteobacteria bacterium]|nr:CpaF family protein [Alphaproteobacteria bacterium]